KLGYIDDRTSAPQREGDAGERVNGRGVADGIGGRQVERRDYLESGRDGRDVVDERGDLLRDRHAVKQRLEDVIIEPAFNRLLENVGQRAEEGGHDGHPRNL